MIHESRIVPLDGRAHLSPAIRQWMGDSRGRWDGDTLVVETRNLTGRTGINQGGGTRHTEAMTLVERFTLTGPDTLQYRVTVDDPQTWTRPWTIEFPWTRDSDYLLFEYGCHEGNYAMHNLLSGSRAEEKRRAEAVARGEKIPEYVEPERGGGAGRGGGGGRGGGRGN
jgi:hypothetical protein